MVRIIFLPVLRIKGECPVFVSARKSLSCETGNEYGNTSGDFPISYPESSGSLVSGLVARRDSGEMEFFPQKSGVPVVVRMLSFIKTEVNVSREVGILDESLDGNQKS